MMRTKKSEDKKAHEICNKLYKDGCALYDSSKYQKAIVHFKEALEYIPGDYQAWMALGNCYDRIKKPHRAEKCFRTALDNAPANDREGIIFNLGNSIYDQGRFAESIELFQMISSGTDIWVKAQRNIELAKTKI